LLRPSETQRVTRPASLGVFVTVWVLVAVFAGLAIGVLLSLT
jgi:hypothetical protein